MIPDSISYIWDDDCIQRLDENNCQCLWFNKTFQGINAAKDLDHLLGGKVMNIKSCYVAMYKSYLTRYQELQNFKVDMKGVIQDYSKDQSINFKFT